ncbi:hypothetical protein PBCV1_a637aL [Paramecium bursaria Chlorella virus 1]|uniref:Uncharacterized protein n=1 Tax=Paramecium bursaria Chlorella virus 1 TaxID=10506 RepID=F8TU77_PBCV1|nr:hypothetical protein PBCV1_a637aL [Paramecium bursaria Chlorella virus 1]AEI70138.1 hypothetical protein [Paramecium bursaria Chlorella virus 1]
MLFEFPWHVKTSLFGRHYYNTKIEFTMFINIIICRYKGFSYQGVLKKLHTHHHRTFW